MDWSSQVFRYCERGSDPAFWGEPLNAVSNAAFLAGALVAALELRRSGGAGRTPEWLLVAFVATIGIGSFLFHTFATRWASIADVAPIGIFMLAYLGYALRRFARLGWIATTGSLAMFIVALQAAGTIPCQRSGLIGLAEASRGPCLNGTLGYAPALLAMAGIGAWLRIRSHPAAPYLAGATGLFFISMVFRTIDLETCHLTRLAGSALGTHFLWHLLNAATLTLLLRAAVRTGSPGSSQNARLPAA